MQEFQHNVIIGTTNTKLGNIQNPANTSVQITEPNGANYIQEGQVVVVDQLNKVLSAADIANAATTTRARLATLQDGSIKYSSYIHDECTVKAFSVLPYIAQSLRTVTWGSSTVSALPVLTDGSKPTLTIRDKATDSGDIIRGDAKNFSWNVPIASKTNPVEVMVGIATLAQQYYNLFKLTGLANQQTIVVTAYASTPDSAVGTFGIRKYTTEIELVTGTIPANVVGNYIRLGANGGIYKVLGSTAKSLTLSHPTSEFGDAVTVTMLDTPANTDKVWIKVEAYDSPSLNYIAGTYEPPLNDFEAYTSGFNTAAPPVVTPVVIGSGTWRSISRLEWDNIGEQGRYKRINTNLEANMMRNFYTVQGQCYHTFVLAFDVKGPNDFTGSTTHNNRWTVAVPTTALYLKGGNKQVAETLQAIATRWGGASFANRISVLP